MSRRKQLFRILVIGAITIVVVLIISFLATCYFSFHTQARIVLREAKNVQMAVKMTALQYYGSDQSFQDGSRDSGLTEAAEQDVLKLAQADGQIQMLNWSTQNNNINQFTYINGRYKATYTYNSTDDTSEWDVSYYLPLLSYKS